MSDEPKIGYMDKIDFDHELGYAASGNRIYPSVENLRKGEKCIGQGGRCGIVKVEVRLIEVVEETDLEAELAERK